MSIFRYVGHSAVISDVRTAFIADKCGIADVAEALHKGWGLVRCCAVDYR